MNDNDLQAMLPKDFPFKLTCVGEAGWMIEDLQETMEVGNIRWSPITDNYIVKRTDTDPRNGEPLRTWVYDGTLESCLAYLVMCEQQMLEEYHV